MVKYDINFSTVCNDLVQFSDTTETLAFTKRNALLGYQKSTDTNFIFCPDGTPVDYKKEGIDANGKGDFYVRVEALLPGMFIEIPEVGKVKVLTVQLGKLFTNRMPGQGVNSIQLTNNLLNENERDMNIWVVTIDKNLFDNNECSKQLYDFFGTQGSTVDLNGEKMKIQMVKEIFDLMVKDSNLTPTQLVDMFYNSQGVECQWTENYLNYNESNVAAVTAQNHGDRMAWIGFFVGMLNEFTRDQQFKDTAATQTTAGGYSIYGNPLEVFVNDKGYELNQVFAKSMIGAYQVDQILDHFLGEDQMNGPNDIVKKENSNCICIPGKDVTRMQQAWDSAFGTIWGNLPDAKTMKTGISKFAGKADGGPYSDVGSGFYGYLHKVNSRRRHAGIAQELFDAFTKGRTAINNQDYTTRDICICIIRRLVSRVILQKTLDYLNEAISTVTQKGVINNPSPNRMHYLSEAMGFLISCTFTHRELDYLRIWNRRTHPYISTELLRCVRLLKVEGAGGLAQYGLDDSVWHLLGKEGVDTLKFMRMVVSSALLENDPPLYLDTTTNAWVKDPAPGVAYTYFTSESMNNAGKQSTFTLNLPTYPVPDTFYDSPKYVETISAFAIPTSLVKTSSYPEIMTNKIGRGTNSKFDGNNSWQDKAQNIPYMWIDPNGYGVDEHSVATFGNYEQPGVAINATDIFNSVGDLCVTIANDLGYTNMPISVGDWAGQVVPGPLPLGPGGLPPAGS
jgi:hypothetical protein